jgi:hypothetical protein
MEITPAFKATRFAQLKQGELFIFSSESVSAVGLAAKDPARDGDMVMIPLGPALAPEMVARIVDGQHTAVVSFGAEYIVQLPSHAGGWSAEGPPPEKPCFVLSSQGSDPSQQKLYLRANFAPPGVGFKPCYVDMKDGRILAPGGQYVAPPGISGYAIEWALLTKETEPRVILSYPDQKS